MMVRQILPGAHRTVVEVLRAAAQQQGDVEAFVEPSVVPAASGHSGGLGHPGRPGAGHPGRPGAGHPGRPGSSGPTPRRSLTFGAWDRAADGLAGLLAGRGVGRGDVVCLVLPSSIDYAVCYAACLRLGAVTSGINPRLGPAEVGSIVDRAAPVLTVVDPALDVPLPPGPDPGTGTSASRSAGPGPGSIVTREEAAAAWAGPPPARFPTLREDDPVAVVWTSGTTGRPKGAVFDHRCLAAVSEGADVLSRPGDRRLSPLPFAHVGYMTKMWDEIVHGITTVITPTPWRAAGALQAMVDERVTVAQGVPTQWSLLMALEELDRADLSSLRIAGTGAAPMPATQVAELRRRLGVPVVVRYASTEAAICTGTVPDDPDEVVATTVGRPVPGVELSVMGEDGREVAPGEPGRVRVRSRAVLRGYWADARGRPGAGPGGVPPRGDAHDRADARARAGRPDTGGRADAGAPAGAPGQGGTGGRPDAVGDEAPHGTAHLVDAEATAVVLSPDGWVTTGDLGVVGPDGNLRLVGREHERYLRGGYNVYPAEVEEVLAAHPSVARAAVVGAPDPVLGEVGVAFVVPAPGAGPALATLRAHCAARLADYKAPDVLVVVEELPLTPMMKVDKQALAAPARAAAAARPVPAPAGVPPPRPVVPGGSRGPRQDDDDMDSQEEAGGR